MKKEILDAQGLACPMPVIQTKKLLLENDVVETIVDNVIATQNLEKMATQLGFNFSVKEEAKDKYIVTISKGEVSEGVVVDTLCDKCVVPVRKFADKNSYEFKVSDIEGGFKVEITREEAPQLETLPVVKDDSYIVVINKDQMGHGSEELGKRLIKAYLYALGEQEVLPKKIIFYNNGGILVDKTRSHVLEELKTLEEGGVEIVCCGACIDYHNIDLAVGNPTNMYFIVEDMRKANKVIQP